MIGWYLDVLVGYLIRTVIRVLQFIPGWRGAVVPEGAFASVVGEKSISLIASGQNV
jgi:hypothetical protein